MDLKCPDSGESHRNRWANLDVLKPTDQIKFVISSRRDWDWTAAAIREHPARRAVRLPRELRVRTACGRSNWSAGLLESGLHRVRMQLQMHKYIWDPKARGV